MKKDRTPKPIADAIEQISEEMRYEEPGTEKYSALAKQLDQLYTTKSKEDKPMFSPDVMLTVGGNLLGIALILSYERLNVITTKALGFVIRSRI